MNGTLSNERLMKFMGATPDQAAAIDRILGGELGPKQPVTTGPLLLGMSAAAKLLGVSRATLWRVIKCGRLNKVEVLPGSFRVRRADLENLAAKEAPVVARPSAPVEGTSTSTKQPAPSSAGGKRGGQ